MVSEIARVGAPSGFHSPREEQHVSCVFGCVLVSIERVLQMHASRDKRRTL